MQARRPRSSGTTPAQRSRVRGGGTTAVRRRLKPTERREQLLRAALRVFARRGLARGTHAEIAAECGVVVGTVFLYFPTREALVAQVLDEVERVSLAIAERCYGRPDETVRDAIRRHVRETLDLVDQEPSFALVWLDWSTAVRDEIWPRYLAFQERVVAHIAGAIARGQEDGSVGTHQPADTCARLIVGSSQMLAQMIFTRQPREHIEAFSDAVVDAALALA
jgi:TetR/AcrR family hemagglutinin/protease transcriptional regulator